MRCVQKSRCGRPPGFSTSAAVKSRDVASVLGLAGDGDASVENGSERARTMMSIDHVRLDLGIEATTRAEGGHLPVLHRGPPSVATCPHAHVAAVGSVVEVSGAGMGSRRDVVERKRDDRHA